MRPTSKRTPFIAAAAASALLGLSACSSPSPAAGGPQAPAPGAATATSATTSATATSATSTTSATRAAAAAPAPVVDPSLPKVTVYKSPACGCCVKWVEHMRAAGFEVAVSDMQDVSPVKERLGVGPSLASCHTAEVGGYAVEGHIPADDVKRLLKEKPKVAGIAVPGMPLGSPGMEVGSRKDPYQVLAFAKDGTTQVFASH
jgi:hypothetical protein